MTNEALTGNASQMNDDKPIEKAGRVRHLVGLQRILAPTDLSQEGRKSVDYAIALAEQFNAQLTILHVYAAPDLNEYSRNINDYRIAEKARATLDSFWSEIKQEYPRIDTDLRCGVAEEQIVAAAKDLDVDLVVISTHKYSWWNRLIEGSDAEYVFQHAPCPILVIRKETKDFVKVIDVPSTG